MAGSTPFLVLRDFPWPRRYMRTRCLTPVSGGYDLIPLPSSNIRQGKKYFLTLPYIVHHTLYYILFIISTSRLESDEVIGYSRAIFSCSSLLEHPINVHAIDFTYKVRYTLQVMFNSHPSHPYSAASTSLVESEFGKL